MNERVAKTSWKLWIKQQQLSEAHFLVACCQGKNIVKGFREWVGF